MPNNPHYSPHYLNEKKKKAIKLATVSGTVFVYRRKTTHDMQNESDSRHAVYTKAS